MNNNPSVPFLVVPFLVEPGFLLGAFRVADFILSDQMTLSQLLGTLATDVVKIGIATGASIVAASAAAAVFTVAVGPIVAAIGVGILVSYGLGRLDEHYQLTGRVIAGLDQIEANARTVLAQKEKQLSQMAGEAVESAIDYAIDETCRIIIDTAKHYISRTIPRW